MAQANTVLLDSLVAERSDGTLIVGRGVPSKWLARGSSMSVSNVPEGDGHRLGLKMTSTGRSVTLTLSGRLPAGRILWQLPSFVDDIATTTAGTIDQHTGTVTLAPHTQQVTVELRSPVHTSSQKNEPVLH